MSEIEPRDEGELTNSIATLATVMVRVENAIGWLAVTIMLLIVALIFHWEGVL